LIHFLYGIQNFSKEKLEYEEVVLKNMMFLF